VSEALIKESNIIIFELKVVRSTHQKFKKCHFQLKIFSFVKKNLNFFVFTLLTGILEASVRKSLVSSTKESRYKEPCQMNFTLLAKKFFDFIKIFIC